MSDAVKNFLGRLANVLGNPRTGSLAGYNQELSKILKGFTDEELQDAATIIFQTQKTSHWPTPGLMLVAAQEARNSIQKRNRPGLGKVRRLDSIGEPYTPRSKEYDDWYHSKAAHDEADRLINSELGRKAADDGWIGDLYDFCREHRRLPSIKEQPRLIRLSRMTDELLEQEKQALEQAPPELPKTRDTWSRAAMPTRRLHQTNVKFIEGFLQRREQLKRIAYGEAN